MSDGPDDARLLEAFASARSPEAFAELVRRHAGWVYASALRQVRDPHAADDVTQTVFALLAAKAGSIRGRPLPGWLFATTRYALANLRRSAARRKRHERAAARPETYVPLPTSDQPDFAPLLDEALAHLRRGDREAVLLRYFRGRCASEVAAELGVSEAAARKRLTRAVGRLRRFFASRGMTVSSAGLVAALTAPPVGPAPSLQKILAAALSPRPATVAAAAAVARNWWWVNVRAVAAVVLAASVVAAGGTFAATSLARAHARDVAAAVSLKPPRPRLLLTCAWDHRMISVPPPASFPEELRELPEYRSWLRSGEAQTLRWHVPDGREYVVDVAMAPNSSGQTVPVAPRLRLLRADGTLLTETIDGNLGRQRQWMTYAADGKTKLVIASSEVNSALDMPCVTSIRFFDADGTSREYLARPNGMVYAEWLLDGQGRRVRLLNGSPQ